MREIGQIILLVTLLSACRPSVPEKSSNDFSRTVKSFYVGLAAMEAADDQRAKTELDNAVSLAPGEPAAWANLGILQMRQKDFETSAASFEKARVLAPDNGQVQRNLYVLESLRGNFDNAVNNLKKAIAVDSNDLKAQFALAREYERQNNDAEAMAAYEQVSRVKPNNLPTKIEIARLAAKHGDTEKLKTIFAAIEPKAATWEPEIQKQFQTLQGSAGSGNVREVSQNIAFFRNVLLRLPEFRAEIADVRFDETIVGEPFSKPLRLPTPDFSPAAPDENLKFTAQLIANEKARWCKAVYLDGDSAPAVAWANDKEIHVGDKTLSVGASNDLQTIDIDYNFKNDFVVVGDKELRFFDDNFQDITAKTKLSPVILNRKYLKAFTFDVEIDGDLDVVLAADSGPPVILQNNADGTFQELKLLSDLYGLIDFVSADLDEDGDMDLAIVDSRRALHVFSNERGGQFAARPSPVSDPVNAVAISDINGDGRLDLVIRKGREFLRATDDTRKSWTIAELKCPYEAAFPDADITALLISDLDNNGSPDIVIAGQVWQSRQDGGFIPLAKFQDGELRATKSIVIGTASDLNGDGRLDLVGLDAEGKPSALINSGSKNYGWQVVRPRSAKAEGDQRVNSFGIGGEMEIRSGLLAQKRVIDSPQVHFGLGEQTSVDLLRIVWGNGFTQAEFDLSQNQAVQVGQRLTGSCPHLFAWNGTEFKFVKDSAPLGTSLGLRVSNTETVPVTQTEEWYKIPGEQLVAKDGFYEIRITDELWESYYVDRYSLMVIDHPVETDVFANELYPIPTPLKLYSTEIPQPFASATNENGTDVANMINDLDENFLGTFRKARYQGVANEHFVELELPADAPTNKPIYIIADGWLHPTDTSLNVAISQNSAEKPRTVSLDVLNEKGVWKTVKDDFGVPASKFKTIVVDLPLGTNRFRLRTNSEVYWDRLAWAVAANDTQNEISQLELSQAELRFRGFSAVSKANDSSPEIADYETIATTTERWRSIEGYYTRFGDILELLTKTDDRYALVTAGDEMRLRFAELPPVREGWKRDFVIAGVGWIKEGDYNNVFSQTVLPLPTRATNDYSRIPTRLEDDPVYKLNSADWLNFHTRYVAPDRFRNAVRNK